jgi:hypothetical protein
VAKDLSGQVKKLKSNKATEDKRNISDLGMWN